MSGQDMRKLMENLKKKTPKKKLDESIGGTPIANDIMELAAKLEAIQNIPEEKLDEMGENRMPWYIHMLDREENPASVVEFLFRWKAMTEEFKAAHPDAYQQIEDQEGVSYFVTGYMDINQLKKYVETGEWEGY